MNPAKDERVPLSIGQSGKGKLMIGMGWGERRSDGASHDLDTSIILLAADGKCHEFDDLCFYKDGHRTVHGGAVIHYGDERTGAQHGDDERIVVNFELLPARIEKIIVAVSIYQAEARGLNFGQVESAYVRLVDADSGRELVAYDLSEDASTYTAIEFCEISKVDGRWEFRALERGTAGGLGAVLEKYGFNVK